MASLFQRSRTRSFSSTIVILIGGTTLATTNRLVPSFHPNFRKANCSGQPSSPSSKFSSSSSSVAPTHKRDATDMNIRNHQTPADAYFKNHGTIPKPRVMHANISRLMQQDTRQHLSEAAAKTTTTHNKILVIGDVHGCLNELQSLVRKATVENNNTPYRCIILVGDLCNKGPQSANVIRFVRSQRHWFSVRGNHDDGALAAALGDEVKLRKESYRWILDGDEREDENMVLSDEDVEWLSELPYTITISTDFWGSCDGETDKVDTVIVHAGLIPNVPLEQQDIFTMVTLRDVQPVGNTIENRDDGTLQKPPSKYCYYKPTESKTNTNDTVNDVQIQNKRTPHYPWASIWPGPQRVIFGHDAKRELQCYDHGWTLGLDTGVCYGKKLTGVILPERKFVSVEAEKVHCPIKSN